METTTTKKRTRPSTIPYCFKSAEEATAAVAAVKERFDCKIEAYSIGKILYVEAHSSVIMRLNIRDFIFSIGGRSHSDK